MKYKELKRRDSVIITESRVRGMEDWMGLECKILKIPSTENDSCVLLAPLQKRPDNFSFQPFHWRYSNLDIKFPTLNRDQLLSEYEV